MSTVRVASDKFVLLSLCLVFHPGCARPDGFNNVFKEQEKCLSMRFEDGVLFASAGQSNTRDIAVGLIGENMLALCAPGNYRCLCIHSLPGKKIAICVTVSSNQEQWQIIDDPRSVQSLSQSGPTGLMYSFILVDNTLHMRRYDPQSGKINASRGGEPLAKGLRKFRSFATLNSFYREVNRLTDHSASRDGTIGLRNSKYNERWHGGLL